MTIRYAGSEERMEVSTIREWARGDVPAPVMSASSGPKDYIKNQVFAEFASRPDLERILMVIGTAKTSVPFCLFLVSGEWRDATKKSVRVDS